MRKLYGEQNYTKFVTMDDYRMAQPMQWVPVILDYMKKMKSSISTVAFFLARLKQHISDKVSERSYYCDGFRSQVSAPAMEALELLLGAGLDRVQAA